LLIAIALAATALGVRVPMLRDANLLDTAFGRYVTAGGSVGELGPLDARHVGHTIQAAQRRSAVHARADVRLAGARHRIDVGTRRRSDHPHLCASVRMMAQSSQLPSATTLSMIIALRQIAVSQGACSPTKGAHR
jgi:hypothetical protein